MSFSPSSPGLWELWETRSVFQGRWEAVLSTGRQIPQPARAGLKNEGHCPILGFPEVTSKGV